MATRVFEELTEEECLALITPGGVGRIAYTGRYGPAVLPVNYGMQGGAIVFRTTARGAMDEDLKTGIEGANYRVAFEIDCFDLEMREGWSVLVQGPAHHLTEEEEKAARASGVEPWAPGERSVYMQITPSRITGRRIGSA